MRRLYRKTETASGVRQVTLTSNGLLLEPYLERLKEAGIDGINISLDTLDEKKYKEITGKTGVQTVLSAVRNSARMGLNTKVNCVVMKGINDDEILDLLEIGREDHVDIRFIEMMPIGFGTQFTGMNSDEIISLLRQTYPGIKKRRTNPWKRTCQILKNSRFFRSRGLHRCGTL